MATWFLFNQMVQRAKAKRIFNGNLLETLGELHGELDFSQLHKSLPKKSGMIPVVPAFSHTTLAWLQSLRE